MKNSELIKTTQKIAYQTIANGFLKQRISHAYLLNGSPGTPLKELAIYLAQSFICEHPSPLACEECINCFRIEDASYPDYILIDGSQESIKKQYIEDIQSHFSLQSLEENGKKIYILHLIENATPGAINSLLKFIEEPLEDVIAIFTTQNITKILQTIISRCQVIRLKDYNPVALKEILKENGTSPEDAYILSMMFANLEDINQYLKKDDFNIIKDLAFETMILFAKNGNVLYYLQTEVYKKINDKDTCRIYLDIIEYLLKDVISLINNQEIEFKDHLQLIKLLSETLADSKQALQLVLLSRGNIETNMNISLLLDSLFYRLLGGK